MMRFEGKTAVVTGSGQGIGETYAKRLAAEGAAVVVAEINEDNGARVAKEILASGGKAQFMKVDVADVASCSALAQAVEAEFGGTDLLINNAAMFANLRWEPMMTVDIDYYMRLMAVNVHGALFVSRALVPQMIARGGGSIVNQSSTAAYLPSPAGGYYGMSKLALNGLTMALANELAKFKIRVNGVAPGATHTDAMQALAPATIERMIAMAPMGRVGTTDEQADVALFLLSDASSFMTGQTLNVDGGRLMQP